MEYIKIIFRMSFFYVFIIMIYRIMGKREVGQLGIIDLIVSILIAELVTISVEDLSLSILHSVIPIICLVIFQIILSFSCLKSTSFRNILDGKPVYIIKNGKVNYNEMIRQKYSIDDLLEQLREKEIRNIEEVEYAILENNGKLSVFTYGKLGTKSPIPMPVIVDGEVQIDVLNEIGKDKKYLDSLLKKKNVLVSDVFYAFIKNNSVYIIKYDDLIKKDYISRI